MFCYNLHMKHLYKQITAITTVLLLTSCASQSPVAPSQNDALNKISNSKGKEKSGYMQQGLDSWLEEDWTPKVEKNEEIRSKYMQEAKSDSQEAPSLSKIATKEELEQHSSENLAKKSQTPESEKEKYIEKRDKPFTLQEYVDKADAYFEGTQRDLENSHAEQLKKMPVIGK